LTHDPFAARSPRDIADLVLDHPLAWVTSAGEAGPEATLLPIRPVFGSAGEIVRLDGHLARRNPQVEAMRRDPRALILFLGPNGYLSPSWLADRSQAPTWNYASTQFLCRLELFEDEPSLQAHLRDLVGAHEAGRPMAWNLDETGERYHRLVRGIIGFRAEVLETRAKFKLGQDERDDVFADMMTGLGANGGEALAGWMDRFADRPKG
jgi:transcriptional regulator